VQVCKSKIPYAVNYTIDIGNDTKISKGKNLYMGEKIEKEIS